MQNLLYTKLNCRLQLLTGPEQNLYFASQNAITDILYTMNFYEKVHNTAWKDYNHLLDFLKLEVQ